MSILASIERIAVAFSQTRTRNLTERSIRALPIELQKDIGWPEAADDRTHYHHGVGSWAGSN